MFIEKPPISNFPELISKTLYVVDVCHVTHGVHNDILHVFHYNISCVEFKAHSRKPELMLYSNLDCSLPLSNRWKPIFTNTGTSEIRKIADYVNPF